LPEYQNFLQHCSSLTFLHNNFDNYIDSLIKLFSNLYAAKFLDISEKSFFLCI